MKFLISTLDFFPSRGWTLLLLSIVTTICIPFFLFAQPIDTWLTGILSRTDDAGVLATLITAALTLDVFLPIPSSLVNTAAGALLGFTFGTLASWLGLTLGAIVGYGTGYYGRALVTWKLVGRRDHERSLQLSQGIGFGSVISMRAVPVLAETSTIAAGIGRLPFLRFLAAVSLANLAIAATYAAIGAFAFETNSFLLAVAAAMGVPIAAFGLYRLYRRHGPSRKSPPQTAAVEGASTSAQPSAPPRPLLPQHATALVEQRFSIDYTYPVAFTRGLFDIGNPLLGEIVRRKEPAKRPRLTVLIDHGVAQAYPELSERIPAYLYHHDIELTSGGALHLVEGGEAIKHGFDHLGPIYSRLQGEAIDRHSFVLVIGGGAVLDAVGFAAATAHRGLRLIRVPTTVLGQNDSGVGVKNAVNLNGVKNYAGTFAPPFAVLNDFDFLTRLPHRARLAGISEAVKVALIRDGAFFRWLEANAAALARFEPQAEEHMIRRSGELHMHQIAHGGDPFEMGSARPLDFGHWAAHKLEALTGYELPHGEAVAIGIALDARYSVLAGLSDEGEDERIVSLLEAITLPVWHPDLVRSGEDGRLALLAGLDDFREHLGGELTITLLREIGVGIEVNAMDSALVAQAIDWLAARKAS